MLRRENIISAAWAYLNGMKGLLKKHFAIILAVFLGYCAAFGACLRALRIPAAVSETAALKLVIDAGHGGIDGGVVGVKTGKKESDLNLEIAFLLKESFTSFGFSVTMTRTTEGGLYDTVLPGFKRRDMEKRKEICESASPLFVISVHQNFYPSSSSRGGQVFYNAEDARGKSLAASVQTSLNELYQAQGAKPRKETTGNYYMLRLSPTSVIVECGFLSNPKDDELLSQSAFQEKLASAIVSGVLAEVKNLSLA